MEDLFGELATERSLTARPFPALCYAPFSQLHFGTDGSVAVCSKSYWKTLGNVATDRILDLWRGPALAERRAALAAGRFPEPCHSCQWQLRRHNVRNHPLLEFDRIPVHADGQWPARLEFAFSDRCNLGCIHCSPELSSVLRARSGLEPLPRVYGDRFFGEIAEFLPHVQELSFLGGEPFLHEELFRLCDLVRMGGTRPFVHVTTNGTVCNDRVLALLDQFPMHLAVSLDGVTEATFAAVRVGAHLHPVLANVRRFQGLLLPRGRPLRLNFCVLRSNWHELPEFLLLAQELAADVWITLVTAPEPVSLFGLPHVELHRIAEALATRSDELRGLEARALVKWQEVLRVLRFTAGALGRERAAAHRREQVLPHLMPLAWRLKARGHAHLAMRVAQRVPPADPLHAAALVLRAEDRLAADQLAEAEALLEQARRLPDAPADVHLRLAWLRVRQGRTAEGLAEVHALEHRLRAASQAPAHLTNGLLSVRANLRRTQRDWLLAEADLCELIQREPDNPQHAEFLALVRAEARADARAESEARAG